MKKMMNKVKTRSVIAANSFVLILAVFALLLVGCSGSGSANIGSTSEERETYTNRSATIENEENVFAKKLVPLELEPGEEVDSLYYKFAMEDGDACYIIDLQPDDIQSVNTFLTSSYRAHQLVLTTTQDTHGIKTAGLMITALARSKGSDLIRNAEFIVNQYSTKNKMSVDKICEALHIPRTRMTKITLDSEGYMDANYAMVPYVLSKGRNAHEYTDFRMRLTR